MIIISKHISDITLQKTSFGVTVHWATQHRIPGFESRLRHLTGGTLADDPAVLSGKNRKKCREKNNNYLPHGYQIPFEGNNNLNKKKTFNLILKA